MSNLTKHKLDDFLPAEDCALIGIVSSAPAYYLCWHLNKYLKLKLYRCKDISFEIIQKTKKFNGPDLFQQEAEIVSESKVFSEHHAFKYHDESLYSEYFLIANKGTKANLDPALKKVNYFFEIVGVQSQHAEQLVFSISSLEPVSMAYLIGEESIINKLKLII